MSMKLNEIRQLQSEELTKRVHELKQELFVIKFQQATGQSAEASKAKSIRKEIAQILTVLKEREITNG